ncbi:BICD family-like cargo adapter 2 [Galemys pyrenaicus]|uniref:BICD family-like cargo adapter 2 n=1 Tax=Galemys pyrenaicus TaxID=202257 RepID=A0A8J6DHP8_GALPY|nr:BICD family-like cargo adapter 2 [Galemys pyrenaicus]
MPTSYLHRARPGGSPRPAHSSDIQGPSRACCGTMNSPEGPSFHPGLLSGGASPSGDEGFFPFVLERRDSFLGGGPRPEEPEDLALQLQQKEKDLLLAAELGKMLLERNEELQLQLETLGAQHAEREERLQQENHELRRGLAARGAEWEARAVELEGDVAVLRAQLGEQRSEQQDSGRERAQALEELSEQNLRLSQQLAQASETEQELQRELDSLRGQCRAQAMAGAELRTRLESLQGENQMLQSRRQDLEAQIRGLREEAEKSQARLQATHEELLLLRRERREHGLEVSAGRRDRDADGGGCGNERGEGRLRGSRDAGRLGPVAGGERPPLTAGMSVLPPVPRQLERARSEAGEALSALRRLQRRVSELEEESRLQEADVSGASLQSELAQSLDGDQDADQDAEGPENTTTTMPPEAQEMSSHQLLPQEESLEPPTERASLSPMDLLEKEAEVALLQDEVGWHAVPHSVLDLGAWTVHDAGAGGGGQGLLQPGLLRRAKGAWRPTHRGPLLCPQIAMQRAELQVLREELQRQKELWAQEDPQAALSSALSDRDQAVNKALELSLELGRVSLERDSLSRELLRTIRQKVALTQELEAWQDDMQVVIGQQLRSQRQKELSAGAPTPRPAAPRFSLRLGPGPAGGFLSSLFRRT